MPCYRPIPVLLDGIKPNGKHKVVFVTKEKSMDCTKIPCGKCVGCLRDRARQWSIRCVHESKFYEQNSFVTLTYNDKNLPKDGSVSVEHMQKFFKRLRKKLGPEGPKIRYFLVGEYGKKLGRPHYHIILFGYHFPDRLHWKTTRAGHNTFISKELSELWPYGFHYIGSVTGMSVAYAARYTMKKVYGLGAKEHYGEKKPEFAIMSRGRKDGIKGLGQQWYKKYKTDVYPEGVLVFDSVKQTPPKYYDRIYQTENPESYEQIVQKRIDRATRRRYNSVKDVVNGVSKYVDDQDSYRNSVKEIVALAKMRELKRDLEETE